MIILLIGVTGLMAGTYFTFSVFIMKALDELPEHQATQAMNKINQVIVQTLFLPVFFGSTLWYASLLIWSFVDWQEGHSIWVIIAAFIYLVGMFLVTVLGNVPLNNALEQRASNPAELIHFWPLYLRKWTRLNHLRTISCIVSWVLLSLAQYSPTTII